MKLVIVGNGITGLSAARAVRKRIRSAQIHLISNESDYPFSRTALMYIYMGHVTPQATECYARDFYTKNRIELIRATAVKADTASQEVHLADGRVLPYNALLIATGSRPAMYGWPGQNLKGVQGLYSMQDLESLQKQTKAGIQKASIVGGGLIGIELCEMLVTRRIPVTMLVREESYASHMLPPEESQMVNREIRKHGVDLQLSCSLKEIQGIGKVAGLMTADGREIQCDFVGLTAGVAPNLDFARASGIACGRGVFADEYFRTSAAGVFAAGDCAEITDSLTPGKQGRLEQLWYTGRIQGTLAGAAISDELEGKSLSASYVPDVFFNSAKFFSIEYQAYGRIAEGEPCALVTDSEQNRSIRICYSKADGRVHGFVLMGIRYRQEVCQEWIRAERDIEYVMRHLQEANFDPEFARRYEPEMQRSYKESLP